jgi:hypothetical protein
VRVPFHQPAGEKFLPGMPEHPGQVNRPAAEAELINAITQARILHPCAHKETLMANSALSAVSRVRAVVPVTTYVTSRDIRAAQILITKTIRSYRYEMVT